MSVEDQWGRCATRHWKSSALRLTGRNPFAPRGEGYPNCCYSASASEIFTMVEGVRFTVIPGIWRIYLALTRAEERWLRQLRRGWNTGGRCWGTTGSRLCTPPARRIGISLLVATQAARDQSVDEDGKTFSLLNRLEHPALEASYPGDSGGAVGTTRGDSGRISAARVIDYAMQS